MSAGASLEISQQSLRSWGDLPAALLDEIRRAALNHRGGPQMLEDLDHAFHDESSHEARLLVASDHRGPLGTLISLDRPVPTIGLVYVKVAARRRGVARQLISRALGDYRGPWDGWSLPGDRATKSLYESLGHKARLLTMSGERVPDGATDA